MTFCVVIIPTPNTYICTCMNVTNTLISDVVDSLIITAIMGVGQLPFTKIELARIKKELLKRDRI